MPTALIFGLTLLAASASSAFAERTVFSTAVLFLGVGIGFGQIGTGWIDPSERQLPEIADLGLFAVLLTDGMHVRKDQLRRRGTRPHRRSPSDCRSPCC